MTNIDIRPSALAGTWYSGNAEALTGEVDAYIRQAETPALEGELDDLKSKVVGLIAPHAGHRFSGPVAGYAYHTVQGHSYDSVVVVSPYHHGHYQPILTTGHEAYETPLGTIPVDRDNLAGLADNMAAAMHQTPFQLLHDQEHSVEIELPFLQRALAGEFSLLPLMLSGTDPATALALGQALGKTLAGQKVLLVASTDLSHFFPEKTANMLDKNMLEAIESFDPGKVIEVERKGEGQACGIMAVLTVMAAAKSLGAQRVKILQYATSGKTSGDYNRVVGYGAGVFLK